MTIPSEALMVTSEQGTMWAGRHGLCEKMKEPGRKQIPTLRESLVLFWCQGTEEREDI